MIHWKRGTIVLCLILNACRSDDTNAPTGLKVPVCHLEGSTGTITEVRITDLGKHLNHGDYVTQLEVAPMPLTGDGIHFTRVTDAVNAAKAGRIVRGELTAAACRISILVAQGTYKGSANQSSDATFEQFPIVIDVPDITIKGAMKMLVDAKGRATGEAEAGSASTFVPSPALIVEGGNSSQQGVSQEIIVLNGHLQGSRGDGAVIEGFVFQTGRTPGETTTGGQGILSMRVTRIEVRGNRFEGGFTEAIDLRASSGVVERNYLTGRGDACDVCLAGPGEYTLKDNRLDGPGGIPGILSVPATLLPVPTIMEQYVLPATATITSVISNNEIRGHLATPVGTGIRIGALGIGAPAVVGTSKATLKDNTITASTFAIIIEAAFPVASGSLHGDIDVTTSGNTISQSCQNDLLVSLSRHTTALGLTNQPYLRNTTYSLTIGSDLNWEDAWYGHPAGFGNTLTVNGGAVANGIHHAYDATRTCT
jgi:hypothetical protein